MEECAGVCVYRVREPSRLRDLERFVGWGERMNQDMVRAGRRSRGSGGRGSAGMSWCTATTGWWHTPARHWRSASGCRT